MDKLTKSETQVLIDYVKGMIQDNKEPEKKAVIALCDELDRVNNLKIVGYINQQNLDAIRKGYTIIYDNQLSDEYITLYRLDK